MSNVDLHIGGRDYTVACAKGQEAHIIRLGAMIDAKLSALSNLASLGETQSLLFAALFLADEIHETKARARDALETVEEIRLRTSSALARKADRLNNLAQLIENLAERLEQEKINA